MIKTNLIDRDPRLAKEIDALTRGGHTVTLLCWDRECQASEGRQWEAGDNYREVRLRFKAPYGIKILPFLPVWWCFEFFRLLTTRWDIGQVVNFDSLIPAVVVAKLKRRPIIYEIVDVYADMIPLPSWLRAMGVYLDKAFLRLADAVIIANEAHPTELGGIPNPRLVGIYNSPPDFLGQVKARKGGRFTLFFAGVLQKSRRANLEKVAQAVSCLDGVQLVVAGYGDEAKEIQDWVQGAKDKAEFIGKISYTEVLERTINSDLLFALYDPVTPTIRYAGGNKLFEAMMAGKPILVSQGTAMAKIVERENCGLTVDCDSVAQIEEAIVKLKDDPNLCRQLGANGRRAYEQKYRWEIMEQRLINLYQDLTRQS